VGRKAATKNKKSTTDVVGVPAEESKKSRRAALLNYQLELRHSRFNRTTAQPLTNFNLNFRRVADFLGANG